MPAITQNITLSILNSKGEMFKNPAGVTYTFQVNPNKLDIADEVQVVESQFLRQNGGIIRPTQVKLRKITGSGKFFDIPDTSADSFPLVSKSAPKSAFNAYQDLVLYMKTKSIMRMFHQYIGEIYVIIQSLSISNTPSPNSIDFTFSFIETMVDNGRTGFERDKNKQVPGMAVSSNADTVQYDTYTVVSGDTLSKIALHFYGSASKWGTIADYNTDILVNGPNVLQIGWILKIPKSSSAPYKRSGGVTPKTNTATVSDSPVEITSNGKKTLYPTLTKVYETFFPDPLLRPKTGGIDITPILTKMSPQYSLPFIVNTLQKILPKAPPMLDAPSLQRNNSTS